MNEVSELSADVEALPVKVVAEMLAVPVTRVHQHVRDGLYLSFRRDGVAHIPADFFEGNTVVKGLQGTIMLMRDGGFADAEILRWLFTEDDSLSGSPVAVTARRPPPRGEAPRAGNGLLEPRSRTPWCARAHRRPCARAPHGVRERVLASSARTSAGAATAARRVRETVTRRCSG